MLTRNPIRAALCRPALCCLALMLAACAAADPASEARAQIQAAYDQMDAAMAQGDIRKAASYTTKAGAFTAARWNADRKGQKPMTQAQIDAYVSNAEAQIRQISHLKMTTIVQTVTLNGTVATITVLDRTVGTQTDPTTHKRSAINYRAIKKETWEKVNGAWKLKA